MKDNKFYFITNKVIDLLGESNAYGHWLDAYTRGV